MRFLKALAALAAVVAITGGVPWALVRFVGNPWPAEGVSLQAPLTDGAIIGLLAVVVWILWAQLVACFVVEAIAAARDRHEEIHLPGVLGIQQQAARALIGAIVVGVISVPAGAAMSASAAQAAPVSSPSTSQQILSTPQITQEADDHDAQEHVDESREQSKTTVTVHRGDTLWSLAQQHLGDGGKWRAIAEANEGRDMGDGNRFTGSGMIRPGWELTIPGAESSSTSTGGDYTVKAGDTLSQIAADELGDATAYDEVFDRSKDLDQPVPLTDPDEIYPGQQLQVHEADSTPAPKPEAAPEPEAAPDPAPKAEQPAPPQSSQAPEPEATTPAPEQSAPQPSATAPQADASPAAAETQAEVDVDETSQAPKWTLGGIGALLAAGVVSLLVRRRRRQQQTREPGQRLPIPSPAAQRLEVELRSVADLEAREAIDVVLRALGAHFAENGQALPVVKLARWTGTTLELYLTEEVDLPAPWQELGGKAAWSTSLDVPTGVDTSLPAPYPTLVTIGLDPEGGAIMVNLEHVGPFAVAASATVEHQVLAAAVVELGTAPWAAQTPVTVVGAWSELAEILEPDRVRYVPELADYTPADELEVVVLADEPDQYTAAHLEGNDAGVAVMHPGGTTEWALRVEGDVDGILAPIGLEVSAQLLSEREYELIAEALGTALQAPAGPSHPVAVPEPVQEPQEAAETATDDEESDEPGLGGGSGVPAADSGVGPAAPADGMSPYAGTVTLERHQVVDETDQADVDEDRGGGEVTNLLARDINTGQAEAPAAVVDVDELLDTGHPLIRLLGHKVELLGARGEEPTHVGVCLRMATYLALHRSATKTQLIEAIWPAQRVTNNTVNPRVSQLRKWLGADEDGAQYLPPRSLQLDERIATDWDLFVDLVGPDVSTAATEDLEKALALVEARPLSGHQPSEFPFAEFAAQDMIAGVVDAAYELARRRFHDGRYRAVEEVAALGVKYEPGQEALWRIWIHAAHSAGNPPAVAEAIERVHARISELGFDLEPETIDLIEALEAKDLDAIEHTREAL